VDVDDRLYAYMHTTRLEIRIHRLSGFHHQLIGRSSVPLCEVLETFATTAGVLQHADKREHASTGEVTTELLTSSSKEKTFYLWNILRLFGASVSVTSW
jgi:hypothetical protein